MSSRFCWHEIVTTDTEAAKAFYSAMFGWTFQDTDMSGFNYTIIQDEGQQFGGLMPTDPAERPSQWISTFRVADVDRATFVASELGAMVLQEPFDMEMAGRISFLADPQGALFSLLTDEFSNEITPPDTTPTPGKIIWHELTSTDIEASKNFYGKVIGWGNLTRNMGTMDYTIFLEGEGMTAGLMPKPDEAPRCMWLLYFYVPDADAALTKAKSLGAQVYGEAIEVPNVGRMGWVADPTGASFAVMTPLPM